ncbi:MAG: hypothetical protein QM756_35355 [Polyangiaceae bacterium]
MKKLRGHRADGVVDAFLATTKAQPPSPESPLGGLTGLGRGGYLLVATREEIAQMNAAVAPRSSEGRYPHLYEPTFLAEIARCAVAGSIASGMESVASAGGASVYMFAPSATDALSLLTPSRRDFTAQRIDEITELLMSSPSRPAEYQRGGVSSAVLIVRGHCLKARAAPGRELYYWFWRRAEA